MYHFLEQLNESQQAAVKYYEGPVMVIAGAGSGKTRVLIYRIAYMIDQGIDPFNILALTFTNKAAKEMKNRIVSIVGDGEAKNVWMGTFHSIFARILRIEGYKIGYDSNFTIFDTDDAKSLLKSILKELDLDIKTYKLSYLISRISNAKNNLISDADYNKNTEILTADASAMKPRTGEIYTIYNNRLKKSNAMDFDDLLYNTNLLLRDFPEVLYKYQQKFKYILVDEYQDTNFAQYLILKKLAAANENICVVGDDAQSIYAFRGANIQNILNFKKDYPDNKVFKLEQNYRSTKNILNAANCIIKNNKKQLEKTIWTHNEQGEKITILKTFSENDEGMKIAQSILEHSKSKNISNKSFAILYRTNAQSRAFEEALRRHSIPYRIYGGLSFYRRKEIKDLLSYFRMAVNHNDEEALKRIINYPARGIGQTTIEKIISHSQNTGGSLWNIIENPTYWQLPVNIPIQEKLKQFASKINSYTAQLKTLNAYDLAHLIAQSSGILNELYENKDEPERYKNIESLLNAIRDFTDREEEPDIETGEISNNNFKTIENFLNEVSLMTDIENDENEENNDTVSLMTIHSAKGLEFPYVYVVGLEENLFPSALSSSTRAELEEERRLFYVAITRAEKRAILSYAESRLIWGRQEYTEPSRFIDEIDSDFVEFSSETTKTNDKYDFHKNKKEFYNKINLSKDFLNKDKKIIINVEARNDLPIINIDDLKINMSVFHDKFGEGKIISLEGENQNKKASVNFNKIGEKTLLLHFAKLKKI